MIVIKASYETDPISDHYKVANLTVTLDCRELPDPHVSPNLHLSGGVDNGPYPQVKIRTRDHIVANSVKPINLLPQMFCACSKPKSGIGAHLLSRFFKVL
jgi:hypothetical protein